MTKVVKVVSISEIAGIKAQLLSNDAKSINITEFGVNKPLASAEGMSTLSPFLNSK